MPFEIFLEDPDSDWNEGVMLEEYQGVYYLISAQKSRQAAGTVYKKWGFPQTREKQPAERAIPWKVRLGSKRQAVKTLEYFLAQLKEPA